MSASWDPAAAHVTYFTLRKPYFEHINPVGLFQINADRIHVTH